MSYPFCSAMVLLEQQPNSMTFLKACNPADFDFDDELDIIINNAFHPNIIMKDLIFSFISRGYFCFDWVLSGKDNSLYSIIILSKINLPTLYYSFFQKLRAELPIDRSQFDPLVQFDYVYSLITSWKWASKYKVLAHYPNTTCYVQMNKDSVFYPEFNPFLYFEKDAEIDDIWKTLIVGGGLHIVSEDPEVLSSSVYAACSLLKPIQFKDKILIVLDPDDERLQKIDQYGIVATTPNVDIGNLRNFGYTVEAKHLCPNFDSEAARKEIQDRTCDILEILITLMNRVLRINPYNDILEAPYVTDDVESVFGMNKDNNKFSILPPDAYRKMENTKSIMYFRRGVAFRSAFRQAFLSMKPDEALKGMSKQHLEIVSHRLDELEKKFSSDKHFVSLINGHRRKIKKLLSK